MSSDFNKARCITLERLDQIFGHETAHLETREQHAIALEAITMFANTARAIIEDAYSEKETVPAPEASLVKALERSPRRIRTGHGDNCPCWDCTRDQFGI